MNPTRTGYPSVVERSALHAMRLAMITENYPMRSKGRGTSEVVKRRILADLVAGQGADFSGQDFGGEAVQCANFFESIFNGCSFTGIRATQSVFQHAEFTEAQFVGCTFQDTSFDHSDFVLASLRDCRFVRCSFQNAEWRDSVFSAVVFEQCIFRNTTTSLARFVDCSFDDASAANFVGSSKRFSVFSRTQFRVPAGHVEFLRTNFGMTSPQVPGLSDDVDDPLFQMSLQYYNGTLTSRRFYSHLSAALDDVATPDQNPQFLRMRYVCGICQSLIDEEFLSVFAIQLLDAMLSTRASDLRDRRQMLEIMSLALGMRVALRDQIALIDQELSELGDSAERELALRMEFQDTYDRDAVVDYLAQMASYCHTSAANIRIEAFHQGSTFIDALIAAGTPLAEVFRFIKYSLSLATVTVSQAGKLKKECDRLTKSPKTARGRRSTQGRNAAVRDPKGDYLAAGRRDVTKEIMGIRSEATKSIEVFVDTMNERVLVVGGKVKVTIALQ